MTDTTTRFDKVMYELKPRPAKVVAVEEITPRYRRVVVTGDGFTDFQTKAPTDHVKLMLMQNGEPVRRDYTPRKFENNELTLEFAIHGNGPLTSWARTAEVGSEITVLGPRGSKIVNPVFDGYVFVGDDTLLPSVGRATESLLADQKVLAIVEIDGPEDEIALEVNDQTTIVWAHRNGRRPGEAMLEAAQNAAWPEGDVFVWAGGEAGAMRDVRRHVLNDRGIDRENLSISGHWKLGESDFDHHAPI